MRAIKNILIVILIVLVAGSGYLIYQNRNSLKDEKKIENTERVEYTKANFKDLKDYLLQDVEMVIVDLREKYAYEEGHVEGAINLPLENLEELSVSNLLDKKQNIYLYSDDENAAEDGAKVLVDLGYINVHALDNISNFEGELVKWAH